MIQIKRAYEAPEPKDGLRILVDRLWPRSIKKTDLALDDWLKDISPSNELRQWFGHKPERWSQFVKKYFQELDENKALWEPLLKQAKHKHVTLIYGTKDTEHNNAVALKQYLDSKSIPTNEKWVHENPKRLNSILKGIAQIEEGRVVKRPKKD